MENNLMYICSRYKGDIKRNKEYARYLTKVAILNGYTPITTHLYLTEALDDDDPNERKLGMSVGGRLLKACKYILVGDNYGISDGMWEELNFASKEGKTFLFEYNGKVMDLVERTLETGEYQWL